MNNYFGFLFAYIFEALISIKPKYNITPKDDNPIIIILVTFPTKLPFLRMQVLMLNLN
jgi:excinuclease UvrABC nuclease subunit